MIIRPASIDDAAQMTALLNDIIAAGGTTAHQTPFDDDRMIAHYIACPTGICCNVAENHGQVLGFQQLDGPDPDQGGEAGWGYVASFVKTSASGTGIGQKLFAETLKQAKRAGVRHINATIRADNTVGLRYYHGLGFVTIDRQIGVPLTDGTPVDRVVTRYDLQPPS